MAGSKAGYEKAREKLLQRYGGEEGLKEHQRKIGAIGGYTVTAKTAKRGFGGMDPEEHKIVAARGGKAPRSK